MRLNQIDILVAICNEVSRQHKANGQPEPLVESHHMKAIGEAASAVVAAFTRPRVNARAGIGLEAWLQTDDIGLSSLFMAHVLCKHGPKHYAHPHDPIDFHRCMLFHEAVPSAKGRLQAMANESPEWRALIDSWEELTALYQEVSKTAQFAKLHAQMQNLLSQQAQAVAA